MPPTPSPPSAAWLPTGDAAFGSMLEAVSAARRRLRLEMYICDDSALSRRFRTALIEARERGVEVSLLLDAFGSFELDPAFWAPLARAGGIVRWFNPISLSRLAARNHRKLLVCDDEVAFVGGYNLTRDYEGDGVTRGFHDFGLRLTGPIVAALASSYDFIAERADAPHRLLDRLRAPGFPSVLAGTGWKLLLNLPSLQRRGINQTLLADLKAPGSVDIISAYFLPNRKVRRALVHLARSGVRVRLLLTGRSDVPVARYAGHVLYDYFLRAGVEIYEYQPQVLHAKLVVLGNAVYAGSCNLDLRSLHFNYELMVRLEDPAIRAEAARLFERDLTRSTRIELARWRRDRTVWMSLREQFAYFVVARLDPWVVRWQRRLLR